AFEKNNILIANIRPYLRKIYFAEFCGSCSHDVLALEANEKIYAKFLYYCLANDDFIAYMMSAVKGIKMPRGDKRYIIQYSIPLPPLAEQKAIADTLGTFDAHIKNLADLIEKKKAIRDGALEDLMSGRTRLKGFNGDWEVKKLGEIIKIKRGKRVVRRQLSTRGDFPVYQNSLEPLGFFEYYNCNAQSAFIIAAGNAGDVGFSEIAFWAADDCFYFEKSQNIYQKFLYCTLLHNQSYIYSQTRRTSIPRLSPDVLEKILIPLPPLAEQKAIAETLTAFDDEIKALEAERGKIKEIRDGAMNDLLTGKVRLKNYGK
ncbi:MAG: restriction endonuclease subunit S, partial [Synergistaceae bacterium]|nr:restriction endonuclease subunit S [Synergistaceae bacterium]